MHECQPLIAGLQSAERKGLADIAESCAAAPTGGTLLIKALQAGGSFRTSTRPMLNRRTSTRPTLDLFFLLLLGHSSSSSLVSTSCSSSSCIHPEGLLEPRASHALLSVECLFSMTLLPGMQRRHRHRPQRRRRVRHRSGSHRRPAEPRPLLRVTAERCRAHRADPARLPLRSR